MLSHRGRARDCGSADNGDGGGGAAEHQDFRGSQQTDICGAGTYAGRRGNIAALALRPRSLHAFEQRDRLAYLRLSIIGNRQEIIDHTRRRARISRHPPSHGTRCDIEGGGELGLPIGAVEGAADGDELVGGHGLTPAVRG